jgi:serine/threonine-protein kinase
MDETPIDRAVVLTELDKILSDPAFKRADRSSTLLRFLVEQTLEGRAERLKEYTLGSEALGRGESFDPRIDPVVRAEASRLRGRLEQYYQTAGQEAPLIISLAKGSYVPQFIRPLPADAPAPELASLQPSAAAVPRMFIWLAGAVIAVAVAVAGWIQSRSEPPAPVTAPPARFEVELRSDGALASDVGTTVVLSSDASRIVFVSRDADGRTHLNTRQLDQPRTVALAGTDGARGPFFAPDGRWVGFWADGKLKKMSLDGGAPVVLCDATDLLGASWGVDDTIIAAIGSSGQLSRIPASGGDPSVAIDLSAESIVVRWPQLLGDGDSVVYTAFTGAGADRANIEVQSLRSRKRTVLVRGGTFGRLVNGYLTYVNQGTLYAVKVDQSSLSVSGAPIPLFDDVAYSPLFGYAQLDVSQAGMLVYRRGAENQRVAVVTMNGRDGITPLLPVPGHYSWLRVSPDRRRVALTTQESGIATIAIYDLPTTERSGVTTRPGQFTGLTWLSRDVVAFGGANGIGWIRADKPDESATLVTGQVAQTPWSVTPNGSRLAYYERSAESGFDLWTVPIEWTDEGPRAGKPEPFLRTRAFEVYPSFSPDGQWIAYASNESGAWEIYVRRFPDDGTKVRVSTAGGVVPAWSPATRQLIFRNSAQQLMVAAYRTDGDRFAAEPPKPWSQHSLADTGVLPNFDVDSNGRVVGLTSASTDEQQTPNHVTLVLNFSSEIRRRAEEAR